MKLREIYETAIRWGSTTTRAGATGSRLRSSWRSGRYEQLPDYLQEVFDKEELTNPYVDTRIYVGDPDTEVKSPHRRRRHERRRGAARRPPAREGHADRRHLHPSPRGHGADQARPGDGDAGRHLGELRRADQRRRVAHGRAPHRGEASLHAHERRPGDRRRAAARHPVLLGPHADRQPRRRLPDEVPRRARAAAHRGRAQGALRRPRVQGSRPPGAGPYIGDGSGAQARRQDLRRHDRRHRGPGRRSWRSSPTTASAPSSACTWAPSCARRPRSTTSTW